MTHIFIRTTHPHSLGLFNKSKNPYDSSYQNHINSFLLNPVFRAIKINTDVFKTIKQYILKIEKDINLIEISKIYKY